MYRMQIPSGRDSITIISVSVCSLLMADKALLIARGAIFVAPRGCKVITLQQHSHEGIIDHRLFNLVQLEIEKRAAKFNPGKNEDDEDALANLKRADGKYLFTGKMVCGVCGKPFCRKKANAGTEYSKAAWTCGQYAMLGKKGCASRRIPERVLIPIAAQLLAVPEEELPDAVSRVEKITVFPNGTLKVLVDRCEEEVTWASPSRRDSWDEKKRQQASNQMKETWKRRKAK